jgi:putative lipoprotein
LRGIVTHPRSPIKGTLIRVLVAALALAALAGGLAGCGGGSEETITGTVAYQQRIALPPDAEVVVNLIDADAGADSPANQDPIAAVVVDTDGAQAPIPFSLDYHPDDIESDVSYGLWAKIEASDGALLFESTQPTPVLTATRPRTWRSSSSRLSSGLRAPG